MITTTLNRIRGHNPCQHGWRKLLAGLGKTEADDEPLPYARIVEINGLDDALWCCRAEPQYAPEWRLYAVWCARQVQRLMTDPRSVVALDVAERYAHGHATDADLAAARVAAGDAGAAAWAAEVAARAAAGDAETAVGADEAAARAATWAAGAAAWAAVGAVQTLEFVRVVTEAGEDDGGGCR
jgi:hypothetical protein